MVNLSDPTQRELRQKLFEFEQHDKKLGAQLDALDRTKEQLIAEREENTASWTKLSELADVFGVDSAPITVEDEEPMEAETPPAAEPTKACSSCKEVKPLSVYNRDRRTSDGHRHKCKDCTGKAQVRQEEKKQALQGQSGRKRRIGSINKICYSCQQGGRHCGRDHGTDSIYSGSVCPSCGHSVPKEAQKHDVR